MGRLGGRVYGALTVNRMNIGELALRGTLKMCSVPLPVSGMGCQFPVPKLVLDCAPYVTPVTPSGAKKS